MKPKEIETLIKYRLEQAQAALPALLLEATLCTLGTNVPSTMFTTEGHGITRKL